MKGSWWEEAILLCKSEVHYEETICVLYMQVLLLDADSQPLKNPESIMQSPYFQAHGNIFWPDFWKEGTSEVSMQFSSLFTQNLQLLMTLTVSIP